MSTLEEDEILKMLEEDSVDLPFLPKTISLLSSDSDVDVETVSNDLNKMFSWIDFNPDTE